MSAPPNRFTSRTPVGEVTLISVSQSPITSMPTRTRPRFRSSGPIYQREPEPKGPMSGLGYSWLDDQLEKAKLARPALLDRETVREGPSFAYEALNLVDGARSVADIREELEWTIGPVPESEVGDYLATLEKLGLLTRRGK